MAGMFIGESVHKVDSKGRVSIPADFRRVLQDCDPKYDPDKGARVTIIYGDRRRNHLECYTAQAMEEVFERIKALPRGSKNRRMIEVMFTSQAHAATVDETGRLVLPAKLRDRVGITNEAVFMATGDTFQIVSTATYEAKLDEVSAWLDDLDDDVDPLTFLEPVQPSPVGG